VISLSQYRPEPDIPVLSCLFDSSTYLLFLRLTVRSIVGEYVDFLTGLLKLWLLNYSFV
jgi:hypothetical protein